MQSDKKATACSPEEFLVDLLTELKEAGAGYNSKKLHAAFELACTMHSSQNRASGEPYIRHPVDVTAILAHMGLDGDALIAALLHDLVEDTAITISDIKSQFGTEVARLVEGVTKISHIRADPASRHASAENIRKILFAMVEDLRVIFIKLADRLHNMRTLDHLKPEKQQRIARETLEVYAPLANRIGIGWIKNELEDLSLKYLDREAYYDLKQRIERKKSERNAYVRAVTEILATELNKHNLDCTVKGRAKHFYSIYKKMQDKQKSFEEVHDLTALRITTREIPECYQVLGIIHSRFRPLYHRFKDYIAMPKSNMYSSLHTTVVGPEGRLLEIQIRTVEMDIIAEEGAASHVIYKQGGTTDDEQGLSLSWLKKLKSWEKSLIDPHEFMQEIKEDLLQDQIYVFTPNGDVKRLSQGATPVDFAYHIHSDIGHHTVGARVNGRMVPLKTELKNCDFVEILTSRTAHPSTSWLKFVKSSRARAKIRNYIKKYLDTERIFFDIIKGKNQPLPQPRLPPKGKSGEKIDKRNKELFLEGEKNLLFELARCCNPAPGEAITGYVSRGRGIIIHRRDCSNVPNLLEDPDRIVYPSWRQKERHYAGAISLQVQDDRYILPEIIDIISSINLDLSSARKRPLDSEGGKIRIDIKLKFTSPEEWKILRRTLAREKRVEQILHARYEEVQER